jgi:large subunit ribosomal protein L22
MEVRAIAKYVRVQPRKVRIIADEVRGSSAAYAASQLRYHPSKGAHALRKVLISAMANAQENHGISPEQLRIAAITVDEGPKLKRIQARAMGRGNRIEKKTSHITVTVADDLVINNVKPHGTKPKPRPTLGNSPRNRKGGVRPTETVTISATTPAPAVEPVTPGETTDTDAEETTAAATPQVEEATPVTESNASEEAGSVSGPAEQKETTDQAEGASDDKGAQ